MEEVMIEGLNGSEIIEDFLDQIRRKLKNSCDLRPNDCYSSGYSATADIHIKLFDVDTTSVDMKIELPAKEEPPVSTEELIVTPVEIEEKIEVEQELNLEAVRKRSEQSEIPPPPEEVSGTSLPLRTKRKYKRRALENVAQGEVRSVELDEKV